MPVADKLPVLTGFHTDMDRYTATPVWAVFKYHACFHDDGEQAFEVPRHVLQALARCFIEFKSGRSASLDHAFGGQTRRQWRSIKTAERNYRIGLEYQRELQEARQQPKSERTGTPSESACAKTADSHSLTEDNVRRIVRIAKRSHPDGAAPTKHIETRSTTVGQQKELPNLIMFSFEEQQESESFTAMPVLAIFKYLECFRDDGEQAFKVPRHILQALAKSFAQFDRPGSGPLDDAFRGQTRRQRQSIEMNARDQSVLFDYWDAYDRARKQPKSKGTETPSECACEEVARRHGISPDTVKAIYRDAGKAPVRRKGKKRR
jgi:hypothetical protein